MKLTMRTARWLLALTMLAAACRGGEPAEPAADLPPALEWKRGVSSPTLLDASSGGTVVGQGTSFSLYASGDTFLTAPRFQVDLAGPGTPVVVLSETRAVFARVDPAARTSALVVDLTAGSPPRTWTVKLSPGSTPLVADGAWLLAYQPAGSSSWFELVNLENPERRRTTWGPGGEPKAAVAAQDHLLVFIQGFGGGHEAGWVRVSPELAPGDPWFTAQVEPELPEVVDAFVEGDEILIANMVHGATEEATPRLRVGRYALADGAPVIPVAKSVEVELPLEFDKLSQSAHFAWDGQGRGVVAVMEKLSPCRDVTVNCLATAVPAYVIDEDPDGFRTRPTLLPYLELHDGASSPLGPTRTQTIAVRDGRLLALTGPSPGRTSDGQPADYELAWYRLDGSTAMRFCEGDVTIRSTSDLEAFVARGCTTLSGLLEISGDMEEVNLPDLTVVGHLWVSGSSARALRLPALLAVAGLERCQGRVGGYYCHPGLSIASNDRLEHLDLPSLVGVELGMIVSVNPLLSACEPAAVLAQLRGAGWPGDFQIVGNGTSLACPELGLCQGGVSIKTAEDWADLVASGCTEVAGDLTITTVGATELPAARSVRIIDGWLNIQDNRVLTSVSLPALTRVGQQLAIWGNTALRTLDLPELASIQADATQPAILGVGENPTLERLDLPALTGSGLRSWIRDNPVLRELHLPSLTNVSLLVVSENPRLAELALPGLSRQHPVADGVLESGLRVEHNSSLERVSLPALSEMTDDLFIRDNPVLAAVDLGVLTRAGSVSVSGSPDLVTLDAPELAELGTDLIIQGVGLEDLTLPALITARDINVFSNPRVASLVLPAITSVDTFYVWDNASLATMSLPRLTSVLFVQIIDNPVLPQCWVWDVLVRQLWPEPFLVNAWGNDDTVTCPPF